MRPATSRRRFARGLSLVELMVALAIVAVVFVGLFGSIESSHLLSSNSLEDVSALGRAQSQIDKMKQYGYANVFKPAPAGSSYVDPQLSSGQGFYVAGGWTTTISDVAALGSKATMTITFQSEADYNALHPQAPQLSLDFVSGTSGTTPSSNYAFYPVAVTISWTNGSNLAKRSLTLRSAIFNVPTAN